MRNFQRNKIGQENEPDTTGMCMSAQYISLYKTGVCVQQCGASVETQKKTTKKPGKRREKKQKYIYIHVSNGTRNEPSDDESA